MRERYVVFEETNLKEEFGLIYSSFEEELPEPKVIKVSIPGGSDVDITEAIGPVAYSNGQHTLKFLLYGDTQEERLAKKNRLFGMLHGQMSYYELSWDPEYVYQGRWRGEVEHLTDNADLVTFTIDRYPWKLSNQVSVDINSHPSGSYDMEGSARYIAVSLTTKQTGTYKIDSGSATAITANTQTSIATMLAGDHTVSVTVPDWWQYVDGTNLVVNPSKITISGTDAAFNSDWVLSGTDLNCANEAKQHSTLKFTREDF